MFNEREEINTSSPDHKSQKKDFLCNLHSKPKVASPFDWIVHPGSGKKKIKFSDDTKIKFFFCAKHENSGKIESHLWFFKGFCAYTNPAYCQMIDAGTIPLHKSISKIVKYMNGDSRVGGCCGEIEVFEPSDKELNYGYYWVRDPETVEKLERSNGDTGFEKHGDDWYEVRSRNIFERLEAKALVLAQYVEYKMSHYLDKSFESLFGFISVLPGAFCTFRWEAINGDPLKSFFKGLEKDRHTAKEANMYLAEDRVMCLEILRKYSSKWLLRYVPGAIALTDPPHSIIGLIKQRRRWTNGSLFASWYVIDHLTMITRSGHSCKRKTSLFILYIYMLINFVFSLALVGSLYASFSIFIRAYFEDENCEDFGGARAFELAYLILLFLFILLSITKPIT